MDLISEEIRFRVPFPRNNRIYKNIIDFKPFLFTCENFQMLEKILEMLTMEYQFMGEKIEEDEEEKDEEEKGEEGNIVKKMEQKLKKEKIKPFPALGEKKLFPRRLSKEFLEKRVGQFK